MLGITLIAAGFILMFAAGANAGLLLIFPFVVTTGPLGGFGVLLLFLGSVIFILSFFDISPGFKAGYDFGGEAKTEKRGVGIVLLGPIPLIIDTKNKRLSVTSLVIFLTAVIVLVLLLLYGI